MTVFCVCVCVCVSQVSGGMSPGGMCVWSCHLTNWRHLFLRHQEVSGQPLQVYTCTLYTCMWYFTNMYEYRYIHVHVHMHVHV